MKIMRFLGLLAIVTMTVASGITEQQTLAQWEKQYNEAMGDGNPAKANPVKAMNALNKFNNRKTPASQAKFKTLWAQFNSNQDFDTPQQATDFYFAQGRLRDLDAKARSLEADIKNRLAMFADAQSRVASLDAIKRSGIKLTKDQESQKKSAQDDINSARRILGIRKEELRTIIEGKGSKKQPQDLGIEGFTTRYAEQMEALEDRLTRKGVQPQFDINATIQSNQDDVSEHQQFLLDLENQLRGGAAAPYIAPAPVRTVTAPARQQESAEEIQQKAAATKARFDVLGKKFNQIIDPTETLIRQRIAAMSDKQKKSALSNTDFFVANFKFNKSEQDALKPVLDLFSEMLDLFNNMSDAVYAQLTTTTPTQLPRSRQEQMHDLSQAKSKMKDMYAGAIIRKLEQGQ